ncbi:MAG: hypothetical protein IJX26_01580 [Clostridia bacterium]|nr:hypothetical protein [Clostridia bacterium]
MTFVKDKSSIKYFLVAIIIAVAVYLGQLSSLLEPVFDNIYYGNLTKMFTSLTSLLIWLIEFFLIKFMCKKIGVSLFTPKEKKGKELSIKRLILLFALAILPMLIISIYLHFQVKIVYLLGIRVTLAVLACNACEILSYIVRILLIIMFISCVQTGFEINIKFNKNIIIPYGAILSFLIFGLIDFFLIPLDLNWFYLICSFYYGVIYLVADRNFARTFVICYLIWLL